MAEETLQRPTVELVWTFHPLSTYRGNVNRVLIIFSGPELFPKILESSCDSPTFSMQSLPLACCIEAVQLAYSCLSGGITLNIGVYSMCSWEEANSAFTCAAILDPFPELGF